MKGLLNTQQRNSVRNMERLDPLHKLKHVACSKLIHVKQCRCTGIQAELPWLPLHLDLSCRCKTSNSALCTY